MKKCICLLALLLIVCCKKEESKIILISGFEEDPAVLRYGIEINDCGDLYYCEEIKAGSGTYNYFHSKIETKYFNDIQSLILSDFNNKKTTKDAVDEKIYNLKTDFKDLDIDLSFQLSSLNVSQIETIKKLESLKNKKMEKIKYHNFPKNLLTYKIPIPPAPDSTDL